MNATQEKGITLTAADFNPAVHDGEVTLISPETGQHRTFRIKTVHKEGNDLDGKRIVSLLTGPNNESHGDWTGFGFVNEDGSVYVWKDYKKRANPNKPTAHELFANMLQDPAYWSGRGIEYLVAARCRRCGRKLTVPESILSGLGPICEGR